MKSIFVLQEGDHDVMLDPKNNIERLRRIRCMNSNLASQERCNGTHKILKISNRAICFTAGKRFA